MRERSRPLAVKPFGRLLASYTVNEIGDSVGIVALAVLVYDRTGDVAPTAALFLAGKFLPALVAPFLTAKLDQIAVRRTLPWLYVLEALVFVALALADGAIAVTARALTRGAIARILQPVHLLREGNAMLNIGFAVAVVGGSALGGLLVSEFGLAVALLADAASFVAIAIVLALARDLPRPPGEPQAPVERRRGGLAFARRDPRVRLLLGGQSIALILFTLIIPIEVIYAKESLGTTSAGFGVLLAAWGAGIVAGSILFVWVRNRSAAGLILLSTAAIGLAYLGMAGAQSLLVACLLSVLGGTGNGIQWVSVMTALQEATPSDYQARVVGLMESALAAMPGVGYLIGGILTAAGSPRTAYAVAGIGTLVLVLVALVALRGLRLGHPSRRRDDPDPAAEPHAHPHTAKPRNLTLDAGDH